MHTYRKWVLTLGIVAATPGLTLAGPLSLFKSKESNAVQNAQGQRPVRSNQQVAESVANVLRIGGLTGYDIDIEFKDGVVLLAGKIGTAQQKAQAEQLVRQIPEVKSVQNQLAVIQQPPAAPRAPRQRVPRSRSTSRLCSRARRRPVHQPRPPCKLRRSRVKGEVIRQLPNKSPSRLQPACMATTSRSDTRMERRRCRVPWQICRSDRQLINWPLPFPASSRSTTASRSPKIQGRWRAVVSHKARMDRK